MVVGPDDVELAKQAKEKMRAAQAVQVLTESVKKSSSAAVVEITIQALKAILEET